MSEHQVKVYGTALDCLDWSDRFDELSERLLVDDALASNNYGAPRPALCGVLRVSSLGATWDSIRL
jgi:hypothetical protein